MNRYPSVLSAAALAVAVVSPLVQAASVVSAPYGVVAADVPNGNSGLSFPLIGDDAFAGRVAANSGNTLTFEGAANIGSQLTADQPYYAEVVGGPLEGERLDVNTAATRSAANNTVVLDLGAASNSTTATLGDNALAQVRVVIRSHLTLAKLQASLAPALVGSNAVGSADLVKLVGPKGLTTFQLRADHQTWREVGKLPDVRNRVIPPDTSVLLQLRSGAKKWTHAGVVRTTAFRKNLSNGLQGFATGFPVDMTPVQIAAYVDAGQPAATRWVGSESPDTADTIKVFDAALNDYKTYYLRADGTTWNLVGDTATNLANSPILKVPSLIAVSRKQSDGDYLIVPPFSL